MLSTLKEALQILTHSRSSDEIFMKRSTLTCLLNALSRDHEVSIVQVTRVLDIHPRTFDHAQHILSYNEVGEKLPLELCK